MKDVIRRKIKCPETLWLIERILDNSNPQEPVNQWFAGDDLLVPATRRHGLPIGNLTSQLWANAYLNAVDHVMAHQFGGGRYIRYVDDFALFSDSKEELNEALDLLAALLAPLRLKLHPAKTGVLAVRTGVNFLGFRVLPDRVRIRQDNLKRARRRFRGLVTSYRDGAISFSEAVQSLQSWNAHAAQGDTWRLRERVFDSLVFARG